MESSAKKTILDLNNASFGYRSGRVQNTIVSQVSFSISLGEFILLVGPNGCGKSTLIRGIFNLVPSFGGSITWHIPQSEIGYIPQESNIDHDIPATALDVVCSAKPFAWSKTKLQGMAALESVGMEAHAHKRFGALSGGQKRRTLLARALFGKPRLLVLDEPTVNTDMETAENIEKILVDLSSRNEVAILATTHSQNWASMAKRYHLEGGRIRG